MEGFHCGVKALKGTKELYKCSNCCKYVLFFNVTNYCIKDFFYETFILCKCLFAILMSCHCFITGRLQKREKKPTHLNFTICAN